jgi:hypothetical protein
MGPVAGGAPGFVVGVLSELQRRVATVFSSLDGATGFALPGGGALIVQGIVERPTDDLDFFATRPDEVNALLPEFVSALRAAGVVVELDQDMPGFARLTISDGEDSTRVDLAADVRLNLDPPSGGAGGFVAVDGVGRAVAVVRFARYLCG